MDVGRATSPWTHQPGTVKEAPGKFLDVFRVWENYRDPLGALSETRREYGDIACMRFLNRRYYVVSDPEAARHVLVENHKNYHKSRNYAGLKVLLGEGLLTSEGETWRRQRKLAQPAFHHERLAALVPVMAECTRTMLERWTAEAPPELDLHQEMMRLTFRIVGLTLLSADLDGESRTFGEALNVGLAWANDYAESLLRIPLWVPTPRNQEMKLAMRSVDQVISRVIAERRARGEDKPDLLSMLMAARGEGGGEGMSDTQLRDELLTLVLAGHETTANALTFTMYLLSRHPEVRRRVEEEVDQILGGRAPELADLPKLRFTTRVAEEAMRLFPPAWIFEREALGDDVIGGYRVHKGSVVGVCTYTMHRNPRFWSNPEGFDPERFLPEAASTRPKHAYLPFGGGPRTCIGNGFAMMELQVLLPMIIQRCRLDVASGYRLELDPSITLRPKRGMPMTLAFRRS